MSGEAVGATRIRLYVAGVLVAEATVTSGADVLPACERFRDISEEASRKEFESKVEVLNLRTGNSRWVVYTGAEVG